MCSPTWSIGRAGLRRCDRSNRSTTLEVKVGSRFRVTQPMLKPSVWEITKLRTATVVLVVDRVHGDRHRRRPRHRVRSSQRCDGDAPAVAAGPDGVARDAALRRPVPAEYVATGSERVEGTQRGGLRELSALSRKSRGFSSSSRRSGRATMRRASTLITPWCARARRAPERGRDRAPPCGTASTRPSCRSR